MMRMMRGCAFLAHLLGLERNQQTRNSNTSCLFEVNFFSPSPLFCGVVTLQVDSGRNSPCTWCRMTARKKDRDFLAFVGLTAGAGNACS
jgi:hypothetical protein